MQVSYLVYVYSVSIYSTYYVSGIALGIGFATVNKLYLGLDEVFLEESNEFGEKEGVEKF